MHKIMVVVVACLGVSMLHGMPLALCDLNVLTVIDGNKTELYEAYAILRIIEHNAINPGSHKCLYPENERAAVACVERLAREKFFSSTDTLQEMMSYLLYCFKIRGNYPSRLLSAINEILLCHVHHAIPLEASILARIEKELVWLKKYRVDTEGCVKIEESIDSIVNCEVTYLS